MGHHQGLAEQGKRCMHTGACTAPSNRQYSRHFLYRGCQPRLPREPIVGDAAPSCSTRRDPECLRCMQQAHFGLYYLMPPVALQLQAADKAAAVTELLE